MLLYSETGFCEKRSYALSPEQSRREAISQEQHKPPKKELS